MYITFKKGVLTPFFVCFYWEDVGFDKIIIFEYSKYYRMIRIISFKYIFKSVNINK